MSLKNVQWIVAPTSRAIASAGFTLSWATGTLGFSLYFPAKYTGENQKKILPFERGAPGTVPYVKSVSGYCITFIKRLDEGLS